jgi:hypothetical protein
VPSPAPSLKRGRGWEDWKEGLSCFYDGMEWNGGVRWENEERLYEYDLALPTMCFLKKGRESPNTVRSQTTSRMRGLLK